MMSRAVAVTTTPYAGRMKRKATFCGLLVTLLAWLGPANGHENQEFHLVGASFCVDPASVQVALDLPSQTRTAAAHKVLTRELSEMLETTLDRSQVAFEVRDRCDAATGYTLLVADVHYLDPKNYVGFGKQAHNYNLFLQVGGYDAAASVELVQQLSDNRYNAYLSEIHAEGDEGKPFEPFVIGEGVKLVQGLAAYWWEDNPRRDPQATLLPPVLGGLTALLTGGATW